MNKEVVLTNDSQRKEFLRDYRKWELVHIDEFNRFDYYRHTFADGSKVTALEHDASIGPVKRTAIITLTKAGKNYSPVHSTQGELFQHLREHAKKD